MLTAQLLTTQYSLSSAQQLSTHRSVKEVKMVYKVWVVQRQIYMYEASQTYCKEYLVKGTWGNKSNVLRALGILSQRVKSRGAINRAKGTPECRRDSQGDC